MLNLKNFFLVSKNISDKAILVEIDNGLMANYKPEALESHFCFFHGILHNSSDLNQLCNQKHESIESVLIELFLTDYENFPSLLSGNFSLVIGNNDYLYLYRDGNGYENIYFSVSENNGGTIIVSNSIKEVSRHFRLEVNNEILPEYFLKTDINSGATFYKDFRTLAFFEYVKINRQSLNVESGNFGSFILGNDIINKVDIKEVIAECDNLIKDIIDEKCLQLNKRFKVINSLSGGSDSTYIQYYLKQNKSDIAFTANFKKTGLDHAYAIDVVKLLDLNHKTVHSDTNDLVDSLSDGIYISEKPFLFAGESLLFRMYSAIGKETESPVACFDGTGAEGIFGASRILYELRLIRKYRFIFGLILPFLKPFSKRLYIRYKEFYTYVKTKTIPDNFILRYFTDEKIRSAVKEAFNLTSLSHIDDYEISVMKKYDICLFEAVYRFLAFELEYRRVNNIRTQLAKDNNIFLVFPFTDTRLFRYLLRFDTEIKLRNAKTKYLFRKAMETKFPKNIVYRKKIMKNVSVSDEILNNENVKKIVNDIKRRQYPYFDFNYETVFSSPEFASLAYKLINFHIWHEHFIENKLR